MTDIERLLREDREERAAESRGSVELHDTPHPHVPHLVARAGDNGVVQFIFVVDKSGAYVCIQGTMLQQLVNFIADTFDIKPELK